MGFERSEYYGDPIKEGESLISLVKTLNPGVEFPESTVAYESELNSVFEWVNNSLGYEKDFSYVNKFLSKILILGGFISDIVDIWGVDELISMQSEVSPISSLEEGHEIFQFGSWSGDLSDGDAWCVDMMHSSIICIPVGTDCADIDEARSASYGRLPNFSYFVSFLASSAIQRGWLENYSIG
jgi:hypothetical protein